MSLDKQKIKSNFNRFSKNYNSLANLQKQVAQRLFEIARPEIQNSQNILDLGCGTGFITQNILSEKEFAQKNIFQLDIAYNMLLQSNFAPNQHIFNINADIENLPFKPGSFDLVLSSLALQWVNDLDRVLTNIKEIAHQSKSAVVFSIFLDGTLTELEKSARELNINLSINNFIALNSLKRIIGANFNNYQIEVQDFTLEHENVLDLIHSIKHIGASYSNKKSGDILLKKHDFLELNKFYLKNFNNCGRIASSWKVAYIKTSI